MLVRLDGVAYRGKLCVGMIVGALALLSGGTAAGAGDCLLGCPPPVTEPDPEPAPTPPTTAAPAPQPEPAQAAAQLVELTNRDRAKAGVAPLAARGDVATIASGWSGHLADAGALSHNDAYFTDENRAKLGAGLLGENVARAATIQAAHDALMASPHHRDNLLDARYGVVGMGAVYRDGSWWVTQDFIQPKSSPAAAAAAPRSATPAAPAPGRTGRTNASVQPTVAAPAPAVSTTVASPSTTAAAAALTAASTSGPATTAAATVGASGTLTASHRPSYVLALGMLALLVALALVAQRSWASASARIRWRYSPLRTSSECG